MQKKFEQPALRLFITTKEDGENQLRAVLIKNDVSVTVAALDDGNMSTRAHARQPERAG